ncbi:hypothetical protein A5320_02605 [Rheinheimera sp. SA_1]|uniref:cyclic peptide export ABC transporter n=1 Tax=Rheinheimera sp. SA_1 TaxID=1827365 RepID=UPI0007FF916A|nr:cyclic peptide export ABC transporter [Rheinheimera sp. SA_1]OBP16318.1 hypothetical protein A5320_02605 [Rheinheimera sp. SA_1]
MKQNLILKLIREQRWLILFGVISSMASALITIGTLSLISSLISGELLPYDLDKLTGLYSLFGLALILFLMSFLSTLSLNRLGNQVIEELRLYLIDKVLKSSLQDLEKIGWNRIYAIFTTDVPVIGQGFRRFPLVVLNGTIIVTAFVYMAYLSFDLFLVLAGVVAVSVTFSQSTLVRKIHIYSDKFRTSHDTLYKHYDDLIHGFRELKLSRDRRKQIIEGDATENIGNMATQANKRDMFTAIYTGWSVFVSFFAIALIIYLGSFVFAVSNEALVGYSVVLLFIRGSIMNLIDAVPVIVNARVSLNKLSKLEMAEELATGRQIDISTDGVTLSFQQLRFRYETAGNEAGFALGPFDLTARPGEVIFFVGGNGSGKTTLAKVMCGLYRPTEGKILVNGVALSDIDMTSYRDLFSMIFFDFYLFNRVHDDCLSAEQQQLLDLMLHKLELQDKVVFDQGQITANKYSQGQRKRLALLATVLESKPIYFFDEWAADQDPEYKAVFYFEILPMLKAMNKIVFVISHDDKYFHVADQLLRMDRGTIYQVPTGAAATVSARSVERAQVDSLLMQAVVE